MTSTPGLKMCEKPEAFRQETDLLGAKDVPQDALYGVHTVRAVENFPLQGGPVHPELIHAFGQVKLAAAMTSRALGVWKDNPQKADAIEAACREMADGKLDAHIVVDALQGGAGTSTNMNVNEVLANRAIQIMGGELGSLSCVAPLGDINLYQSTNDAYPTALKLAAVVRLRKLEKSLTALVEAFQRKEKQFANVVKIGRTELQDAVLLTLGREMSAYAEAFGRDRWRIEKCEERLRVVNMGGTAIGTGLTAPRDFIFRVVDTLRDITGIGFARAENMVDNTQNADVFAEVSGMLKTCAVSLMKVASDLRLLSSGPECGIGEISLPALQAGSSIMPGKVNPVVPESVTQVAIRVMGYDLEVSMAAASGNLELNAFMPLIADSLLRGIDLLAAAIDMLRTRCVDGITVNEEKCRANLENSTALVTALLPLVGYKKALEMLQRAQSEGKTLREAVLGAGLLTEEQFNRMMTPEAVMQIGSPRPEEM